MDRAAGLASPRLTLTLAGRALLAWSRRQVLVAAVAAFGFALVVGVATVLIPNPVFGRDIPPVAWNYPVWMLASALTGMLVATYSRADPGNDARAEAGGPRESRMALAGGLLTWFAVGCPVCNKIALLALGYSGAITWFAPVQPLLAIGAVLLSGTALVLRLRGQVACTVRVEAGKGLAAHEGRAAVSHSDDHPEADGPLR